MKRETHTEWTPAEASAKDRRRFVGWIVLVAYSLLLVCRALRHSGGSGIVSIGVWELQDSRRLLDFAASGHEKILWRGYRQR
jgi:hypothetical protein